MPSNYTQITADNIRRRGEEFDDIGRLVSEQLYSDRTHFVYELLQNAEDALMRRAKENQDHAFSRAVHFELSNTQLAFSHFGQPFNQDDVGSISDILRSTGGAGSGRIGRFGIGFKSVYAFTASPHIYSGDEHFRIERFIRPCAVNSYPLKNGETRFEFPFDHQTLPPHLARTKISDRLRTLDPRTLLFLRHVTTIKWSNSAGGGGSYHRKTESDGIARRVRLLDETPTSRSEEKWLLFDRPVTLQGSSEEGRVEIAYLLDFDERTGRESIKPINDARLVVYFPTDKDTRLGFLIQGPYLTTPARDNIPNDPYNTYLVHETATLIVDSLSYLKEKGLLTVQALQALPIKPGDFPTYGNFRPIYDQVREALRMQPLLPAHKREVGHVPAKGARLARVSDLRELLTDKQLGKLFGSNEPSAWLSEEISLDRTPDLRSYLIKELGVSEIDSEEFASALTEEFIARQPDEWVRHFYAFLDGKPALWRASSANGSVRAGVLRSKGFIRLQDGRHVVPFRDGNVPNAYLPVPGGTSLPTIKATIVAYEPALNFLKQLGITTPDVISEVIEKILPKYEDAGGSNISDQEYEADVFKIFNALRTTAPDKKRHLVERLKEIRFLIGVNAADESQCALRCPAELYFPSDELALYFQGNPGAWFLRDHQLADHSIWRELGIADTVRSTARKPDAAGFVSMFNQQGFYERGLNDFDPEAMLDGLEYALGHITTEKAAYIWNMLLTQSRRQIYGKTERSTRKNFDSPKPESRFSRMGKLLTDRAWLPSLQGGFAKPGLVALFDLPSQFHRLELIASTLRMRSTETRNPVSTLLGFDVDFEDLEFLKKNWSEVTKLKQKLALKDNKPDDDDDESEFDYAAELRAAFGKPGLTSEPPEHFPPGNVVNPERRRAQVAGGIREEQEQEPPAELRFKQVPRKTWEAKNNLARVFLAEQYGGHCQICRSVFHRRDNQPYFEGLYLVSRINKAWVDRSGNMLCLCANCCAKFLYGSVVADDILDQIEMFRAKKEGGKGKPCLSIELCDNPIEILFTEQHMIELQTLLSEASAFVNQHH